ncbi:MAG: helix-turn-helix domain-containing protein [Fidelibacterota bacterium]
MNVQVIEKNGKPEWAIIPFSEYEKIQEILEDAEDIQAIENFEKKRQAGEESLIPGEIVFAIMDGKNPIRAWREHKKLKISALAEKANISAAYLSQIETGKRNPTIDTLKTIAKALDTNVDLLID